MNQNGIVNFHQFQNNNNMLVKYNQTMQQIKDNQYIQKPIENTQISNYNKNTNIINNNPLIPNSTKNVVSYPKIENSMKNLSNPINDSNKINNEQERPLTGNTIHIPNIQNNQNINYGINCLPSTNNMQKSREIKLKKQEEYRKYLDEQLKQDQERKEREKQMKYGTMNGINNNINGNINYDNNNKNITNGGLNIVNDNLSNTITKKTLNNEEKEKQRKKQMEYNEMLRQQVEERNKRKELQKQKEKEEDQKYEEKLKQQMLENQARAELYKNQESKSKYINNVESPENFLSNPIITMPLPQYTLQKQLNQKQNQNTTGYSEFYPNVANNNNTNFNTNNNFNNNNFNNIFNNNNNYNNNNTFNNNNFNNNNINNNINSTFNNNNFNNNNFNTNTFNNNKNNDITSSGFTNSVPIINNNTFSPNSTNQLNYNNNIFNKTPLSSLNNTQKSAIQYGRQLNQFNTPDNTGYIKNNLNFNNELQQPQHRPISQQLQVRQPSWKIEELYLDFVNGQLKIIQQYENNINDYKKLNKDNFETIKDLMNLKNKALDDIQKEQNKFKNIVGIYPMDNNFNSRVTNLMDMMLEKKINEIQRENKLQNLSKNYNKQKIIQNDLNKNKNSNTNKNDMLTESKITKNLKGLNYHSKYEELKQSMINGNDASEELKTSISLAGFSKFVVQNKLTDNNRNIYNNINNNNNEIFSNVNNGLYNLYTTWDEDNFTQNEKSSSSSLRNIDNNIKADQKNNNEIITTTNNQNIEALITNNNNTTETNNSPNYKYNHHRLPKRNNSKGILNDSQLPSRIVGNDKGFCNHADVDITGSNISIQDSNSNMGNYINGSDLNIEPTEREREEQGPIDEENMIKNNLERKNNRRLNKLLEGKVKNIKISKEEKEKSFLLVGDNMKNNLSTLQHYGYSQREKDNKEKSYLIGNINGDNTLVNNTNNYTPGNNTLIHINNLAENTYTQNNDKESDNDIENEENMTNLAGITFTSKRNGGDNNETEEDIVRGFGQSGINSMLNDDNNITNTTQNNSSIMHKNNNASNYKSTFGKKKGLVNNNNQEIQQIKEAEEKEEEEYACDFTLDNKTLKQLEEQEKKSQKIQKVNLEDYREIRESQKLQTQLNFFEDSVMDKINVTKSKEQNIKNNSSNNTGNKRPLSPKNKKNNINNTNGQTSSNKETNSKGGNQSVNKKEKKEDESSFTTNNNCNDSFGDNIINDLDKYRKMALEESSMSFEKNK